MPVCTEFTPPCWFIWTLKESESSMRRETTMSPWTSFLHPLIIKYTQLCSFSWEVMWVLIIICVGAVWINAGVQQGRVTPAKPFWVQGFTVRTWSCYDFLLFFVQSLQHCRENNTIVHTFTPLSALSLHSSTMCKVFQSFFHFSQWDHCDPINVESVTSYLMLSHIYLLSMLCASKAKEETSPPDSIKFCFIYIASNHCSSSLKALYIVRSVGDLCSASVKKKLPFNMQKSDRTKKHWKRARD